MFHQRSQEHLRGLTRGHQPLLAVRWSDVDACGGPRVSYRRARRSHPLLAGDRPVQAIAGSLFREAGLPESTLCHEMIHARVDLVLKRDEGHGPYFRERMAAINASQSRFEVSVRYQASCCRPSALGGCLSLLRSADALPPSDATGGLPRLL